MNDEVAGVCRGLSGAIRAVGLSLAMILSCLGLACGNPARPAGAPTGTESGRSGERSGEQAAAWIRAVPAAHVSAGVSKGKGSGQSQPQQAGTMLSAHWLAAGGAVTDTEPVGKVVTWPPALRIETPAMLRFRVDMPQTPSNVDVRLFDDAVDAMGAPVHEPELISCTEGRPARAGCAYSSSNGGLEVILPDPPSRPVTRIVLYAEWYVPYAQRPVAARSNATVSASWGFVLETGSAP